MENNYSITFNETKNVLHLGGRIDTNNSSAVSQEINKFLPSVNQDSLLIVDLKDLEYVSSSGLRIFLTIIKSYRKLKFVNANKEIYGILEMTGFTSMVEVAPALREVSVQGLQLLGEGFVGSVYKLDDEKIIKVYHHISSIEDVYRERNLAKQAFILGIPTPMSFEIVKIVEGGFGSIFEVVNSECLNKLLLKNPDKLDDFALQNAKLFEQIITTEVTPNSLPNKKEDTIAWVKELAGLKVLDESVTDKLIKMVNEIPERNTLVHGDFHIKNVMVENGEFILIDMDTLGMGHPLFEAYGFYQSYRCYPTVDPGNIESFFGVPQTMTDRILEVLLDTLFKNCSKEEKEANEKKIALLAYARVLHRTLLFTPELVGTINGSKEIINKLINEVDTLDFWGG